MLRVHAICFFFFKQKTAYELRISDWSSDVCSSDLASAAKTAAPAAEAPPVSTPAAAAPVAPTAEVAEPKRRGPKPGFKRAAKVQPAPSDVAPIRDEDISDPRFKGIDPWLAKRISPGQIGREHI